MMHYPQEFMGILGALQKLGANRFINGAMGMSVCKWVSINYIVDNNISGVITNQSIHSGVLVKSISSITVQLEAESYTPEINNDTPSTENNEENDNVSSNNDEEEQELEPFEEYAKGISKSTA